MTATIIPFPNGARAGIGTPDLELARLAVAIHLRALRKGQPSSYGFALEACQRAVDEMNQEKLAAAQEVGLAREAARSNAEELLA